MEEITCCELCTISFLEDPVVSRLHKVQIQPCKHVICKDCMIEKLSEQAIPFRCPLGSCQKIATSNSTHRLVEASSLRRRSNSNEQEIVERTYHFQDLDKVYRPSLDQHRINIQKFILDRKDFPEVVEGSIGGSGKYYL